MDAAQFFKACGCIIVLPLPLTLSKGQSVLEFGWHCCGIALAHAPIACLVCGGVTGQQV
jgi:hypothetical protein